MFGKSFVSIYFLPNKLLVIEVSSNRKKVVRHASVDLPDGLIENYKVIDPVNLAKILKSVWNKFHFNEKTVGLILPEFSIFTKLLKIPRLAMSELNEAVNWQAQEYLPTQISQLITDWKIVDRSSGGFDILLVAVNKDLLMGYVEGVEKAGLFPLMVEIPSVGLVRLLQKGDMANLIICKNFGETILIISQNEKIIGTSVIHSQSPDELVKTALRMINHYKETKVDKILFGGLEINEEITQKVTNAIKLPIERLKFSIKNLDENKIQEYLIPLSMSGTEVSEPSDPSSLNLLPLYLVEKYKKERLKLQVWSLTLTITLFVWISFLVVLGGYLFMVQEVNNYKAESLKNQKVTQQGQEALKDVTLINTISDKILKIKKEFTLTQEILNKIQRARVTGIILNSYDLDLDRGLVRLSGVSSDRNTLVEFKRNLESNDDFSEVAIPISNFEEEFNLEFEITFSYKGSK
ncbi:MAG: Type IV pilus assembly protein PilM [Candidatus Woesebacteria bacterium GW2011_GWA1_39_12]|uniref:Type IV pilus assembly protein PilM n=2 Tax=Candidatus Woeseibacteriota TaxID=1752722 RepID=A0A0G0Q9M0_9BACT|nr:MAG: Type IV pilus assembly protein PilM [Candidatus Woesebacteria bacterium GW2011_GWA1_39_12]